MKDKVSLQLCSRSQRVGTWKSLPAVLCKEQSPEPPEKGALCSRGASIAAELP